MRPLRKIALIFLAAALLASCQPSPRHGDVGVGKPIPAFELPALSGGEISSASYLGKPVVLNFWATWCGPCEKEIPTLKALHRDSGATVVTIAIDEQGEDVVRPFVEKHGIDYPVLIADAAFFRRYNGTAVPYTLILDPSLRIVRMHRGYVSLRSLERDLRRAES
jgi:thiol-disulfide isomerase/thioredoxin